MWADYIKERENIETIQTEYGFVTYKIIGQTMVINDIYVKPTHRRKGCGLDLGQMAYKMAQKEGLKWFAGSVNLGLPDPDGRIQFFYAFGLKFVQLDGMNMFFQKEVLYGFC